MYEFQPDDLTEAPRHALNQTMLKAEKLVHLITQLEVRVPNQFPASSKQRGSLKRLISSKSAFYQFFQPCFLECIAHDRCQAHVTGTNFRGQPVIVFTPASQAKYDQVNFVLFSSAFLVLILR